VSTLSVRDMTEEEVQAYWVTNDERVEARRRAQLRSRQFLEDEVKSYGGKAKEFVAETLGHAFKCSRQIAKSARDGEVCTCQQEISGQQTVDSTCPNPSINSGVCSCFEASIFKHALSAPEALMIWLRKVEEIDAVSGLDTIRGLEKQMLGKFDNRVAQYRRNVVGFYKFTAVRTLDVEASNSKSTLNRHDEVARYAQHLSLSHRLYCQSMGEAIAHQTRQIQ
jgi:hypothetical protein